MTDSTRQKFLYKQKLFIAVAKNNIYKQSKVL